MYGLEASEIWSRGKQSRGSGDEVKMSWDKGDGRQQGYSMRVCLCVCLCVFDESILATAAVLNEVGVV